MYVKNVEILVSSVEVRKNSKTNLDYLMLGILTLDDGTNFSIIEKDMNKQGLLKPMNKYKVNLKISSSQYGINVAIEDILKDEGNIMFNSPIEKAK
ncbi:conserved hypothetical protein [Clostridium neonatale]|uniref:hypothetical protein n=1 Tax=Clostridium neonatale TaxID=137838 RepID=UPI001DEE07F4|nr:hypothetical protein [Clostridium neonatale]CAG9702559.1 conserved hypothetical protein [Clostridium neonatale]